MRNEQSNLDQSKNVSVTAGALFSLAIVGYLLTPLSSTPANQVSTDLSIQHSTGRKLMGYHYEEEEKALARTERRSSSEVELSATDYWLDDTLQVGNLINFKPNFLTNLSDFKSKTEARNFIPILLQ